MKPSLVCSDHKHPRSGFTGGSLSDNVCIKPGFVRQSSLPCHLHPDPPPEAEERISMQPSYIRYPISGLFRLLNVYDAHAQAHLAAIGVRCVGKLDVQAM